MAHDPSLAYADYFAAAAGGGVSTLVPEDDDAGDHLYGGVHQAHNHGLDMFGVRGLMPPGAMVAAAAAHGKAAALGDFTLADHHHHLGGHNNNNHAPLMTSLSLHGPSDAAAALALHHHHQLGGVGTLGQQQQQHHVSTWPAPQQQMQLQQGAAAWHLRGSRFLRPTQQLLQEFCSLPVEDGGKAPTTKAASEEEGAGEGTSSAPPSAQIQAMDAAELQRLKAKLYAMLQEVGPT